MNWIYFIVNLYNIIVCMYVYFLGDLRFSLWNKTPRTFLAWQNICRSKYMPIKKFACLKIRLNPFIHPPPNILVLICIFYNINFRLYLSIPPNKENEESKLIWYLVWLSLRVHFLSMRYDFYLFITNIKQN
jgi:hypothetical protein